MKGKILLADDEAGIRKVLGITLADMGYEVLTAADGLEALGIFERQHPLIVLTDIKMPGMDGIDLLQQIKQKDPDTEVIMITGHGDLDLAIECLKLEATDFITKPINNDALEIALKRAHDKITMRQQLRQYTENLEQLVMEKSARLIEAERLAALGQAVEGISTALKGIAGDIQGSIDYFDEMPCFVAIHNRDLKVVATNELYRQQLGEHVGHSSWQVYGKQTAPAGSCPAARTFKTGRGQRISSSIRYKNGQEYPVIVHTAPIRNSSGDLELVLEISGDITEIRRLQEALQATRQKYQKLFDEVPCYISVQDRDFRLTATNRRFKEDFGEDVSTHCYEIYKQCGQPCDDCPVAMTFEDGKSHQAEMAVTDRNGREINVLVWTAPIVNTAGNITQVMEMATDITQVRKLQDHLASLGLMVSSVSHGIKGVLTGLDAGIYFLQTGLAKGDSDQTQEGMEVVKLMAERIRNVVLDILYSAKERDLNWSRIDVLEFMADVAFPIENKIRGKAIELKREFSPSAGVFEADADAVRSALGNILENAVEACLDDQTRSRHRVTLGVFESLGQIIFEIGDNGVGMDRETCQNIFTQFYSSKGNYGTGLGLFIANKIIRRHGGSISVDSSPGRGTRFRITLPQKLPASVKQS